MCYEKRGRGGRKFRVRFQSDWRWPSALPSSSVSSSVREAIGPRGTRSFHLKRSAVLKTAL